MSKRKSRSRKKKREAGPDLWFGLIFGLLAGILGNLFVKFFSHLITPDPFYSLVGTILTGFALVVSLSVLWIEFIKSLDVKAEDL
jgi:H+/Cl- antiporter ClcA